jgi:hypothetical protein
MSVTACESKIPSNTPPLFRTNLEQRMRLEPVLIRSRRKEDILTSDYLISYPDLYGGHSRQVQNA